jgi:hypothetical protein
MEKYREKKPRQRSHGYTDSAFERKTNKPRENIEKNEIKKKYSRRRVWKICPWCSNCCCLASTIGALLFLAGLAALLVYIFTMKHPTTTATTITTTTSTS